jgi:hypothetical protein
MMLEEFQHQEA